MRPERPERPERPADPLVARGERRRAEPARVAVERAVPVARVAVRRAGAVARVAVRRAGAVRAVRLPFVAAVAFVAFLTAARVAFVAAGARRRVAALPVGRAVDVRREVVVERFRTVGAVRRAVRFVATRARPRAGAALTAPEGAAVSSSAGLSSVTAGFAASCPTAAVAGRAGAFGTRTGGRRRRPGST
ncbi:MAG: hypothetical protein E6G17_03505 [Actinobacteria bacterium]|nr:MAG: hypothetical protein E6G17_03505 [Actinomycetota bacterium]